MKQRKYTIEITARIPEEAITLLQQVERLIEQGFVLGLSFPEDWAGSGFAFNSEVIE